MPEYVALYSCKYESAVPPYSPGMTSWWRWTFRYFFTAENLDEVRELARKQRDNLKNSVTTVTPATILEVVDQKDGQPVYKTVQTGILEAHPDLRVSRGEMGHLQTEG